MKLHPPIVGWFHLSNDETSKAKAFLRLCNGEGSVDELGFGILRDGFSDEFFPATSVVMTEPRYLIFVAAIYRSMERTLARKKTAIPDPLRRSRKMQDQLRDVLSKSFNNEQGHGVIGISVHEPERYPSAIYWASLRSLGIFRLAGATEGDYVRGLSQYHNLVKVEDNNGDPVAEVAPPPVNWDRRAEAALSLVLDQSGNFLDGVNFELSELEARYLCDCYLGPDVASPPSSGTHQSLLAHLIKKRWKTRFNFPWEVNVPAHLADSVADAQRFSALTRGAILQYYGWLISARRTEGWEIPSVDIEQWFGSWWREARPLLLEWDEDGFLRRRLRDLRSFRNDATFLKEWLQHFRAANEATAFLTSSKVRALIVEREKVCKLKKARLTHKTYLKNWKLVLDDLGTYQMNFRAPIGSRFVERIVETLNRTTREHEGG